MTLRQQVCSRPITRRFSMGSDRFRSLSLRALRHKRVRLHHSGLTPSAIELQMGSGYHAQWRQALLMESDPIIDLTAHDLFDAGLWTIDDNLRIQVAKSDIAESILPGGSHFKLADLHDRPLSFAPQATLRPDPAHLAWHRHEVFGA